MKGREMFSVSKVTRRSNQHTEGGKESLQVKKTKSYDSNRERDRLAVDYKTEIAEEGERVSIGGAEHVRCAPS